jgi:hypothetical protein
MRVFGGYGSSKEYSVEQLYRAAPLLMICEGTSNIQQLIIPPPAGQAALGQAAPPTESTHLNDVRAAEDELADAVAAGVLTHQGAVRRYGTHGVERVACPPG